ncbi:hypothetical protein [Calothrix sp. UHCC 0171]|uniref:hypothetical protein n=1 Tax=Calothrix sp. UHCC 0171 TaxID=3110245 RepID=UPI002B21325A|nr:hypothetical protein [Calothrix sp. UHCC 0171]MEA5574156.1 hypothetical protein [Calothrix sp. UHCC 0171]
MDLEPENIEFAEPATRKPLEILRDAEISLRRPTVAALVPVLPSQMSQRLQKVSSVADNTLNELAEIDIEEISDWELRNARIWIGLSFVGFGALMVIMLLLYLSTLHPELNAIEQVRQYWYQYVWFVCLGVAGMFLLGREAMRPVQKQKRRKGRTNY